MAGEQSTNGAKAASGSRNLPVLASNTRPLALPQTTVLPAPVVAATGGFLAGVATLVLARLMRRKSRTRVLGRRRRRDRGLEVAGTRSFLVDVHLLRR